MALLTLMMVERLHPKMETDGCNRFKSLLEISVKSMVMRTLYILPHIFYSCPQIPLENQ
jgi:hypothetical protein